MSAEGSPTAPVVPGYVLGEPIGRGGAGSVWAATRAGDGAPVAVKVVPVGTDEQAESLAREFAVLARVDVEGLVGFHEALGLGGDPAAVALVFDRVGGGSLEAVVRARGHLSVGESVTILAPVARALAGLHGLGVVHGDVTPANILLERTGRPLLADLGVASLAGEVPGQLYGTPGFVAPEVLDRGVVSTASDVYAAGALAWWCVTGSAPPPVVLRPPLEELAPGLPEAWADVTRRALLGDPALRPTAAELALAYYDSAACEPLRLAVGSDETSLLTQRLRQPQDVIAPSTEPPWRPDATSLRDRLRDALARASAPARVVGARMRELPERRRAAALGTATLLVVALAMGGLMASDRLATPGWVQPHRDRVPVARTAGGEVVQVSAPTVLPTSATALPLRPAMDPATNPAAPRRDPQGLMVALATLRAEVMVTGSMTALDRLDAPGSPALGQDTAVLRDLAESGRTWRDVALRVVSARTVSHAAGRATLDAVVETAAYRMVDASGRAEQRAAVAGQQLRFVLAWSTGRWRVESIAAVSG